MKNKFNKIILVRQYLETDFPLVCNIEQEVFSKDGYSKTFIRQAGEIFSNTFLVAEIDSEVIGYILGSIKQDKKEIGWIISVAVLETQRRKGAGKKLSKSLLEKFKELNVRSVYLSVSPANMPSKRLFEGLGFKKIELVKDYFGSDEDREIMMMNMQR